MCYLGQAASPVVCGVRQWHFTAGHRDKHLWLACAWGPASAVRYQVRGLCRCISRASSQRHRRLDGARRSHFQIASMPRRVGRSAGCGGDQGEAAKRVPRSPYRTLLMPLRRSACRLSRNMSCHANTMTLCASCRHKPKCLRDKA